MKVIKLNKIKQEIMEAGGGSAELTPPNSLDDLRKIFNYFSSINSYTGTAIFFLVHKSAEDDRKNDPIPAPSRRFVDGVKFIFSNNKKEYETTIFDEDEHVLKFVYDLSYAEILDAITKLEKLNLFFSRKLNDFSDEYEMMQSLFDDHFKEFWKKDIEDFKNVNSLTVFSISSIRTLLSSLTQTFDKFEMFDSKVVSSSEFSSNIVFSSSRLKEKAIGVLEKSRVSIAYEDEKSIDIVGEFSGRLEGAISTIVNGRTFASLNTTEANMLERAFHNKIVDTKFNDVIVGVIDGGISETSFVREDLYGYDDNKNLFGTSNPKGSHAERVASILLYANNLNGAKDNLSAPRVHLFNIISEDDDISIIKRKVKKVVAENPKIKIWNFSVVFKNIKSTLSISHLGVFFDKLQREHEVLFIFASGNKDEDDATDTIDAPSGSFFGLSIAAVNLQNKPTTYSKPGYKKFVTSKPDLAIFGGDIDCPISVISENMIASDWGTSYAAPLIARKVAYMMAQNVSLRSAVAILINYANYYSSKKGIEKTDYIGHGVIPVNSDELIDMVGNKALIVIETNLEKGYKHALYGMKIPQRDDKKYDISYFASVNVDARFEDNETYEYILDSARIAFGKADGNEIKDWTGDDRMSSDPSEGGREWMLRTYKGKFKSRDSFKKEISKAISPKFTVRGKEHELKEWGFKITRNAVRGSRVGNLPISICLILESKEIANFYNEYIIENHEMITNINELQVETENIVSDEINFQ